MLQPMDEMDETDERNDFTMFNWVERIIFVQF